MAIEAGNVVWNITGNVKPLNDALGDSEKMVQSSMGNILKIGQQIGVAFTAIGAGITAGFASAINATMDYGGEIQDAATKTGIAAEELQKLKYGAEQSGVGFEGLQGAIIKMNKSIAEARDGTKAQSEAFVRLGIDLKSLQGLSPDQQFMRIADALSRVTDPALKTSLAMDLFGKSGAQLIPFLNEGAAGMQALGQKAQELGLVMSGDSIAQAEAFGDQWETLKTQFQMVAIQIGSALIPALMEMMPAIQATVASVINWIQQNPQLVTTIATVVGAVGAVMAVLGPLLIMLPGIVQAFTGIKLAITALSFALPVTGAAFTALAAPILVVGAALVLLTPLIYANIKAHQDLKAAQDQEEQSHQRLSAEIEKYIAWLQARGVAVDRAAIAQMTTDEAIAALNAQHAAARQTQTYKDINELEEKKRAHEQASDDIVTAINMENQARVKNATVAADTLKEIANARKSGVQDEKDTAAKIVAAQAQLTDDTLANYVKMGLMTEEQVGKIHEIMIGLSPATRHSPSINDLVGEGFSELITDLDGVLGTIESIANKISGVFSGIQSAIDFAMSLAGSGGGGETEGRALGGPVSAGVPYIVGEGGEELFVPDSDGRIIPANQTAQMIGKSGGATTININGYNRDPRSLAEEISRIMYSDQLAFGRS